MTETFTPRYVTDMVDTVQYHHFPGTNTIVCCITMHNGYAAVGESTCYDADKFDERTGEELAYNGAMKKLRSLENYRGRANRHDARVLGRRMD